jgi:regulator of sirC expression with transglutaminase-like and TPR domain
MSAARQTEPLECLRSIGTDDDSAIDLGEVALLCAAVDRPGVSLEPYRRHLADLAQAAAAAATRSDSIGKQTTVLREILAVAHGYRGDSETYDDMRNANLIDVIDRRRGLPVALGILYIHTGRGYDSDIVGLSFPSHFLVRLTGRGQRAIIDPFNGGRTLETDDLRRMLKSLQGEQAELTAAHHQGVDNRDVIIRLQNNIKLRAVAAGDLARAVQVLKTMTAIAPGRAELWWETAVLLSKLGNLKTAITTLEGFLAGSAEEGRAEIEDLLRRLRSSMN